MTIERRIVRLDERIPKPRPGCNHCRTYPDTRQCGELNSFLTGRNSSEVRYPPMRGTRRNLHASEHVPALRPDDRVSSGPALSGWHFAGRCLERQSPWIV